MFDLDRFKADCNVAIAQPPAVQAIREVVARAVEDPHGIEKALGQPRRAEVQTLWRSSDLTILNVIWGPRMTVMPHSHEMWAVVGIYSGREDNILWRRLPGDASGRIDHPASGFECCRMALRPSNKSLSSFGVNAQRPGSA